MAHRSQSAPSIHRLVDLVGRAASRRAEAWTTFDPDAPPYRLNETERMWRKGRDEGMGKKA